MTSSREAREMVIRQQSVVLYAAELEAAGIVDDGLMWLTGGATDSDLAALRAIDKALSRTPSHEVVEAVIAAARKLVYAWDQPMIDAEGYANSERFDTEREAVGELIKSLRALKSSPPLSSPQGEGVRPASIESGEKA